MLVILNTYYSLDEYVCLPIEFTRELINKTVYVVKEKKKRRHTVAGIRWWSPTQLLTSRRAA